MRDGKSFGSGENGATPNCDGTFDWNAGGDEVLKVIDQALQAHGLEIVKHETYGSFYAFSIKKVKKAKSTRQKAPKSA